jgi:hypothetical protein
VVTSIGAECLLESLVWDVHVLTVLVEEDVEPGSLNAVLAVTDAFDGDGAASR